MQALSSALAGSLLMQLPSVIDNDVFKWQNQLRTNPKSFIPILTEEMNQIDAGGVIRAPGKIGMRTKEGKKAWQEAINFLNNQNPVKALKLSNGLSLACKDHVQDQGPRGTAGNKGSDGSDELQRMNRHGTWKSTAAENISYGHDNGKDVIKALLVDDGVAARGHRKNLFDNAFGATGMFSGPHKNYRMMTCIDYAGAFKETNGSLTSLYYEPKWGEVHLI